MRTVRTVFAVLLVVAIGMGAALVARRITGEQAVAAAGDRPSGAQRPLTTSVSFAGDATREAFTMRAPADAEVKGGPAPDSPLRVQLRDARRVGAVLVVTFEDMPLDPVAALETVRDSMKRQPGLTPGSIRRTEVAGMPAAALDVRTASGLSLRELRFVHGGIVWGVGLLFEPDDQATLDTGLAMVQSWRWT